MVDYVKGKIVVTVLAVDETKPRQISIPGNCFSFEEGSTAPGAGIYIGSAEGVTVRFDDGDDPEIQDFDEYRYQSVEIHKSTLARKEPK